MSIRDQTCLYYNVTKLEEDDQQLVGLTERLLDYKVCDRLYFYCLCLIMYICMYCMCHISMCVCVNIAVI